MGYHEEQKKLDRLAEVTEIATNAAAEVKVWLSRHPEVKDLLCNYSVIYGYYNQDLESIDQDSLDQAYENHSKFREMLAYWPNEQDEKDALSDKIIELLRPGTSPQNLKAVKDGHKYKSVGELRIRVQELQERSDLHKKSTAELRQMLQKPEPEHKLPSEISAEQIKHMWGADQFRFWAKKFNSMEPINRRLRGED
jgi:hypothetical protein